MRIVKKLNHLQITNTNNLTLVDEILAITFCLQSFIKYLYSCPSGRFWLWNRMSFAYFGDKKYHIMMINGQIKLMKMGLIVL